MGWTDPRDLELKDREMIILFKWLESLKEMRSRYVEIARRVVKVTCLLLFTVIPYYLNTLQTAALILLAMIDNTDYLNPPSSRQLAL